MLISADTAFLLVIDMQEKLLPAIAESTQVERNCGILLQAAHRLNMPAIISEQYPKGLGRTVPALAELAAGSRVLDKVEFSCARDIEIMTCVEATNRRQAVLCGVEAHICVLQTAIELKGRGFDVFVAIDACGSRKQESGRIAADRMAACGVNVVTTEMVVFEVLEAAGSDHFKYLSKLIQ